MGKWAKVGNEKGKLEWAQRGNGLFALLEHQIEEGKKKALLTLVFDETAGFFFDLVQRKKKKYHRAAVESIISIVDKTTS